MLSSAKCLCVKFICFGFPNDCSILGLLELRHQIILSDRPTGCPQTRIQLTFSSQIKTLDLNCFHFEIKFPPYWCGVVWCGVWCGGVGGQVLETHY